MLNNWQSTIKCTDKIKPADIATVDLEVHVTQMVCDLFSIERDEHVRLQTLHL